MAIKYMPLYIFMDSLCTNVDVWDRCGAKRCHLIGTMKANRILYPNGVHISASYFASKLTKDQLHFVMVKGRKYYVHRHQRHLKKIDKTA